MLDRTLTGVPFARYLRGVPRWIPILRTALAQLLYPVSVGSAVLSYELLARGWLYRELNHVEVTPFSYDPYSCSALQFFYWAREDIQVAVSCVWIALIGASLGALYGIIRQRAVAPAKRSLIVHLPIAIGLVCIGLAHAMYYKVAFVMHAQLDYGLIDEALQSGFAWDDFSEYWAPADAGLVLLPLLLYVPLGLSRTLLSRALQGLGVVLVGLAVMKIEDPGRHSPRRPLQVNPVAFLYESILTDRNRPKPFHDLDVRPEPADLSAMGLKELEPAPLPSAGVATQKDLSVLVVIMESVGRRYAFPTSGKSVMPHLAALRESSLFFANHLSPSNSSGNSLFSFFTGLYPAPSRTVVSTQPGLRLPVLHEYMPWLENPFLVTAGRINSYFPRGLLTNAKMELLDRYDLRLPQLRPSAGWFAADERDGVDSFLKRLGDTQSPYFAVYYSYAAHYNYYDHGPEFRVMANVKDPYQRYLNNLALLDTQLERIMAAVRARPGPTMVVVMGDHGEAFGQHAGNYQHSRNSYQENFETFALVNLPGVFPAQTINELTLHIDLVPTILAGLRIPFNAARFQGFDVLGEHTPRPYAFFYGNEDTLSSISAAGTKVQLSYASAQCRAYDLVHDPDERLGLECQPYAEQVRRMGMFHAYQKQALKNLATGFAAQP
jgi:hypothetical protein